MKEYKGRKVKLKLLKIKRIIEAILIISVLLFIGMIGYDYYDMKKSNKYTADMVSQLDEIIDNNEEMDTVTNENEISGVDDTRQQKQNKSKTVQISGCSVYGKIAIDKISIEYPIIEYVNEQSLLKSICKISSNNIEGTGNLCLAGHNMRNTSFFGNLKKITNGDIIKITDLYGNKYIYEVYKKFYVKPDQTEILKNTDESIITLITCNDSSTQRLIVRGKLI